MSLADAIQKALADQYLENEFGRIAEHLHSAAPVSAWPYSCCESILNLFARHVGPGYLGRTKRKPQPTTAH
jgi:hypothetical protein